MAKKIQVCIFISLTEATWIQIQNLLLWTTLFCIFPLEAL